MSRFILVFLAACGTGSLDVDADADRYDASEDCDDDDPTSHPGAAEVCDGADNDCDGQVDNGGGTPYYADVDGDGYGDPAAVTASCATAPAGTVANADDCDDTDPAVNPLGAEVCDGLDNDCDGAPDWGLRVPADFAAIGAAIGASQDGDHVCVSAGRYIENIDFSGRKITVEGLAGPEATVIDGGGVGPVVSFDTKEGADTVLTGFTITGGDDIDGAGIYLRGASPTLRDLVITGNACTTLLAACRGTGIFAENSAFTLTDAVVSENEQRSTYTYYPSNQGAGIWLDSRSKPLLRDVQIEDNLAELDEDAYYGTNYGVGLYLYGAVPTLEDVVIAGNRSRGPATATYSYGVGVYVYNAADVTFDHVLVADNVGEGYAALGGGIYAYYSTIQLTNSAIVNNRIGTKDTVSAAGAGIYSSYATPELENVDIVGNRVVGQSARGGGLFLTYYGGLELNNTAVAANQVEGSAESLGSAMAVDAAYPYGTIRIDYSNFHGNGAGPFSNTADPVGANGNLTVDPAYTSITGDGVTWDLSLRAGSAMIDAGDPELSDRDGTRSDIGSQGGPEGS